MPLREELAAFFGPFGVRNVVLVGIGNPVRGDDGVGLAIRRL